MPSITKEAIFHYVYAVLHHPAYRKKYEVNLKREFPRIPLYDDFWQWSDWGKTLLDLHLNYETAAPYPLGRVEVPKGGRPEVQRQLFATVAEPEPMFGTAPKARLRADKTAGVIELDTHTLLRGVPPEAWNYKLGNRSALEWILDQYKETKPSDPTIAAQFNTYRFADYKEHVIELLKRVCTVSVETMRVVNAMP